MNKMKKVLAILLTLAMALGMSVTAFAADAKTGDPTAPTVKSNATGKTEDTGTITVDGLASNDVTVTAYRIIKAKYTGQDGLFSGYEKVYTETITPDVEFEDEDGNTVTDIRSQIGNLAYLNAVIPAITNGNYSTETYSSPVIAENGKDSEGNTKYKATFGNLPVGSYVIMITGTEANTYNPIIASIYYDVENDANVLQQGNINLIGANTWAKRSDSPDVEKKIVDGEDKKDSDDAKIGDIITYQVEINPIPEYDGKYPVLKVTDTLRGGLELKNVDQIKVEEVKADGTVTELNASYYVKNAVEGEKTLTIDFAKDYNYQLNNLAKTKSYIRITYYAELTEEGAQYNHEANENEVVLTYTKDSKTEKGDGDDPDTKKDKTYTYTFDLDIDGSITKKILTKTGDASEEDKAGLAGAEFTLYKSLEGAQNNTAADKYTNEDTGWTNPITSTTAGQLPIKGLAAGTYYLKETKAPEGYSLNTHIYKIEIAVTGYNDEGKITGWTVKVDDDEKSLNSFVVTETTTTNDEGVEVTETKVTLNGTDKIVVNGGTMTTGYDGEHANETEIKNTTLTDLPSTGGIGTTIFTIGGCIIMIAAAGLFFASRRKKAEN